MTNKEEKEDKTWYWVLEEDSYGPVHWIDCTIGKTGLSYYGTDYTHQSGGGYTGGFQTFNEFMEQAQCVT